MCVLRGGRNVCVHSHETAGALVRCAAADRSLMHCTALRPPSPCNGLIVRLIDWRADKLVAVAALRCRQSAALPPLPPPRTRRPHRRRHGQEDVQECSPPQGHQCAEEKKEKIGTLRRKGTTNGILPCGTIPDEDAAAAALSAVRHAQCSAPAETGLLTANVYMCVANCARAPVPAYACACACAYVGHQRGLGPAPHAEAELRGDGTGHGPQRRPAHQEDGRAAEGGAGG